MDTRQQFLYDDDSIVRDYDSQYYDYPPLSQYPYPPHVWHQQQIQPPQHQLHQQPVIHSHPSQAVHQQSQPINPTHTPQADILQYPYYYTPKMHDPRYRPRGLDFEHPIQQQHPLQELQHQHQEHHRHHHDHHDQNYASQQEVTNTSKRAPRVQKCHKCGRLISRDMSRHMRIHESVSRFKCLYPREHCPHKTGFFNRQYDYKKHLLHAHFQFIDQKVKRFNGLNEKLTYMGLCPCGERMTGEQWLDHVTLKDSQGKYLCAGLRSKWQ